MPFESRRLPVYFLVDCSPGFTGPAVAATQRTLQSILNDLRGDPQALESVHLSVITYSDTAEQACPLTELLAFTLPSVRRGRGSALGAGLRSLEACMEKEVLRTTPTQKGDWKPVVFLLTNSKPTDDWLAVVERIREKRLAGIVAVATGPGADPACLKKITDVVIEATSLAPEQVRQFFKWVSASVKSSSAPLGDATSPPLSSPSSGITIVP